MDVVKRGTEREIYHFQVALLGGKEKNTSQVNPSLIHPKPHVPTPSQNFCLPCQAEGLRCSLSRRLPAQSLETVNTSGIKKSVSAEAVSFGGHCISVNASSFSYFLRHNMSATVSSVTLRLNSSVCPSIYLSIHPFIQQHLSFLLSLKSSAH